MIITCASGDQDMVKLLGGWREIRFRKPYCITIIITITSLQYGCRYSISFGEVTLIHISKIILNGGQGHC